MGNIRVENSFPYERRLLGNQHSSREKEYLAYFSKYYCAKYEAYNHATAVPGDSARETDACSVLGEFS